METKAKDDGVQRASQSHAVVEDLVALYADALKRVHQEAVKKYPKLESEDHFHAVVSALEAALGVNTQQLIAPEQQSQAKKKPVRVYVDGCFDIMHSGHYNAIRQAKALGDVLVVGVHSDAEIMRNKGPPVMNEEERLAVVKACKWADEVVFDTPYDPSLALLDKLQCDFCVHGDDMPTTADGKDAYGDVKKAGRIKIIKRTEGVSTTDLVGRLLLMTKNHHVHSPPLSPTQEPQFSASFSRSPNSQPTEPARPVLSPLTLTPPPPMKSESPWRVESEERGSPRMTPSMSNFLPTTWRIAQFSNNRVPKPTDKVVYLDGAFDLFHVGHIATLEAAKKMGDFLYVGIHDDRTVNKHKGKNYPIMNLHERVLNVLSCKWVDEVVIGAPWTVTEDLIKVLNISVVVTGTSHKLADDADEQVVDADDPYAVPRRMGIFKMVDSHSDITTSVVVDRIIKNRLKYEKRNAPRAKKEQTYLSGRQYIQEL